MPLLFAHDKTVTQPVVWVTTFVIIAFHIGALVALFFFSWKAFLVAMFLWWLAGGLGVGVGYHRLLTHRGYKTHRWVEYFLTVCGTLTLEGGPIFWVATHRMHHQNTDKDGDPHSPRDGGFWAHVGWLLTGQTMHNDAANLLPYVPDLRKDKFHVWISRWHWLPITLLGLVLLAAGGWKFLLWGIFFRTVLGLHSTWLVNSATHMWGSRRFPTGDTSKNSFWVALLTFGEGWHTNHHAHPQSARHGLAWYELDLNWYGISALRMLGLAWDLKAQKLNPVEDKTTAIPGRLAAGNNVKTLSLGMNGNAGG
jgi:stearoyl-CoA desaturase (delta-9 desaturase)